MAFFSLNPNNVPWQAASILYQPTPPIPPFPPLPPMPVPPGGPTTDTFDLSSVDTATEALIMPGADLLTSLIVASSPSHRGHVTVQCNNQKWNTLWLTAPTPTPSMATSTANPSR